MNHSPVQPAHLSRLDAADEEIKRRKQEVLDGVMAALQAQVAGADHPRLLTPERKESLYIKEIERREHYEMSKRPPLPQIIVTKKFDDYEWRDFTNTIRGRFGAIRQE